ncbi:aspartate aminotransferase [Prevotella intermedia]|uniref:cysteine-S-conjugate beta-lyase n=1 Tax=Prevotella intermedia TaxID=28131 RepID=A0AAD1BJ41_PREIN|nr:MalY/PatB family protein [Prevotella intermedia]AFJ08105.1 putative cystathionine beta-lyase PatB [Prevotella intermedia 17]APW33837.1 cystathionine beta-lyase [Prevotella intermedia]BAR96569.1 aspartate aminotransferase [Prevotella intermedia]
MGKYNFDELVNRRGTNSVKWDEEKEDGIIPLWVADMDFLAAPAIRRAVEERAKHGVFGYAIVGDSYYAAITNWFKRRHNWAIERDWIIYTTGVIPAISATIHALAMPGEKVLIQTPVYNCFYSCIRNQGLRVLESPLKREDDTYVVDWDDFEAKCADKKTTLFLLCTPHNPAGRVWTKDELARMNEICMRHDVKVISDEIHCELIMPGYVFTPFATVSADCQRNSVVFNSPTKNFNIAGLQIANIICADKEWYRRIDRAINIFEVCDVNPFGPLALEAAYNESEDWIDELMPYIADNYALLKDTFAKEVPSYEVLKLEGTYLAWVDIRKSGLTANALTEKLLREGKVQVNSGVIYSKNDGEGYIRINLACPRATLQEGLKRIVNVLKACE